MKHSPIALGFAAFSALTVLSACNVDEGRVDKNAKYNNAKWMCENAQRLNLNAVNNNRFQKLSQFTDAKVRSVRENADGEVIEPKSHKVTEVHGIKSLQANAEASQDAITLVYNCDNLTAELTLPKSILAEDESRMISTEIVKMGSHKVELKHGDISYVVETVGIDVGMNKIDDEDGVNQIKVTQKSKDGKSVVFVSDSVKNSLEDMVITDEDGKEKVRIPMSQAPTDS